MAGPKILIWDIETVPLTVYSWGLFEQNIAPNQVKADWHILSWAAKWLGSKRIFYMDQRYSKSLEDDKAILKGLWKLLDEADVVITQNGKAFDSKKVNARFILNGLPPPSPYLHIDTKQLAKKHFAFTSNGLEYMSSKLCKTKKGAHRKFPGFELWRACMAGKRAAWRELERYNKLDVIATEELYLKLAPWGVPGVDLNIFRGGEVFRCQCGSTNLERRGFKSNRTGRFQRFQCRDCHAWCSTSGADNNLLSKAKRKSLRGP